MSAPSSAAEDSQAAASVKDPADTSFYTEAEQCQHLLIGPARGLACLHCTQPEAQAQARVIALLLYRSCLKNIAINYLVDGTFSFDAEFLQEQISLLTSNGRRLSVYFYLTNGPTQRQWSSTTVEALGVRMSPEEFRWRISSDTVTRDAYQQLVERLLPIIRYAESRGALVSIVPALEDNLSDEAFYEIYGLTVDALPADVSVSIGRNSCEGCYEDNGSALPAGVFREVHTASPFLPDFDEQGLVTNDGVSYYIPGIDNAPAGIASLEQMKALRDAATSIGQPFILWNSRWQGRYWHLAPEPPHPRDRIYAVPGYAARMRIIEFLREGF